MKINFDFIKKIYYYILILFPKNNNLNLKIDTSKKYELIFSKNIKYEKLERLYHEDIIKNIIDSDIKTVVNKTKLPPSKDIHDFCDLSPYFWPNPITKIPYIYLDGHKNPEVDSDMYDRISFGKLYDDIISLTNIIFYNKYTELHEKAFNKCIIMLKKWFIDNDTKMNPNMNHAQMIPGWLDGSSLGLIRLNNFVEIFHRCSILKKYNRLEFEKIEKELFDWLYNFLIWIKHNKLAKIEFNRRNNHATWFVSNICNMCQLIGCDDDIKYLISESQSFVNEQILDDGSQPFEDLRGNNKNLHYAIYNIKPWLNIVEIAKTHNIPFDDSKIKLAMLKYNYIENKNL